MIPPAANSNFIHIFNKLNASSGNSASLLTGDNGNPNNDLSVFDRGKAKTPVDDGPQATRKKSAPQQVVALKDTTPMESKQALSS